MEPRNNQVGRSIIKDYNKEQYDFIWYIVCVITLFALWALLILDNK